MLISKSLDWVTHPTYTKSGTPQTWALGLAFILCVAYLWHRILGQVIKAV